MIEPSGKRGKTAKKRRSGSIVSSSKVPLPSPFASIFRLKQSIERLGAARLNIGQATGIIAQRNLVSRPPAQRQSNRRADYRDTPPIIFNDRAEKHAHASRPNTAIGSLESVQTWPPILPASFNQAAWRSSNLGNSTLFSRWICSMTSSTSLEPPAQSASHDRHAPSGKTKPFVRVSRRCNSSPC